MTAPTFPLPTVRTLCIMLGLVSCASPALADTIFTDTTFNDADWSLTTRNNANGSTSTVQGFQVGSGGNGGSYRFVRNQMEVTGQYALVMGIHMKAAALYDPATHGAVTSMNYSEDAKASLGLMGTGLAILQGGNFYLLRNPVLLYAQGNWNTVIRNGITASDMHLIDSNGSIDATQHPDFSASGGIMQLGFWRANGSGTTSGGSFTYETGIDNWSVTVIPSPGAAFLVGMAGLLASRRRD